MKTFMTLLLFLASAFSLFGADFEKRVKNPVIIQEGSAKAWCSVCGMNLGMYYKTNHAVELKDGTKHQYCSIRCLAHDHDRIKSNIKKIYAVDAQTGKLIDATRAHYVIGSKAQGTMTRISKFAFADPKDAKAFKKRYGGRGIEGFETTLNVAKKNLASEAEMFEKKREKKLYPKGKMIAKKMCKSTIDTAPFANIAELKSDIVTNKRCGKLNEKELQVLSVYLWDMGQKAHHGHAHGKKRENLGKSIVVPKDAKCPVCGMFVYKYPRWAAKMIMADAKEHYFDGVKDMFKFFLQQKNSPNGPGLIMVTDYYTQDAIQARSAVYVSGSDVYGPMGNELIPFSTVKDAKIFMGDHNGVKIFTFDEITMPLLESLDE